MFDLYYVRGNFQGKYAQVYPDSLYIVFWQEYITRVCNIHNNSVDGVFHEWSSSWFLTLDCSLLTCSYINYGMTRTVLESAQLHLCAALQFIHEQVVSTIRQSTTTRHSWKMPYYTLHVHYTILHDIVLLWRLHILVNVHVQVLLVLHPMHLLFRSSTVPYFAMARFGFKAMFEAVTIRGWLELRAASTEINMHTASIISLFVCNYNILCICALLSTLYHAAKFWGWHFIGMIWQNHAAMFWGCGSRCGKISRKYSIHCVCVTFLTHFYC